MVTWCTKAKSQPKHSLGKVILSLIFSAKLHHAEKKARESRLFQREHLLKLLDGEDLSGIDINTEEGESYPPSFIFIIELRDIDSFEAK